jgi:hypothetical protein
LTQIGLAVQPAQQCVFAEQCLVKHVPSPAKVGWINWAAPIANAKPMVVTNSRREAEINLSFIAGSSMNCMARS